MAYNPSFHRNPKGKFNPELGFVAVKGGENAFLTEDELNELQWIQSDARASLVRSITDSGCLQINGCSTDFIGGGLKELGNSRLNSFLLYDLKVIVNGYLSYVNDNNLSGNVITLPEAGQFVRQDFVFIEFWFNELKLYDKIPKFGGIDNAPVRYEMIDERFNLETTRRIQLQWRIRTYSENGDGDYSGFGPQNYDHLHTGFIKKDGSHNQNIKPQGINGGTVNGYFFRKKEDDDNLFISGYGTNDDISSLKSVDGFIYALPLFIVNRLNNKAYHPTNNPMGGLPWVDNSSESQRPDRKFCNIIYGDQIIDIRDMAYIGKSQLDKLYVQKNEFQSLFEQEIKEPLDEIREQIGGFVAEDFSRLEAKVDNNTNRIQSLEQGYNDVNNSVVGIINSMSDLRIRIENIEFILRNLDSDPAMADLLMYNIKMQRNNILLPGGNIVNQSTGQIDSIGVAISTSYSNYNDYVCTYTLFAPSDGKVGDVWIEKADTSYLIKNSGSSGIKAELLTFKNDDVKITRGTSTFNGMTGRVITQPIGSTDFIYVTQINRNYADIGEICVNKTSDNFTVYNTGVFTGIEFEWFILDTSTLTNVEIVTLNLNGQSGVNQIGQYGEDFKVLVSQPTKPTVDGSIGEVFIQRSFNMFTVYNTGSANSSINCLIFKSKIAD